MKYTKGKWVKVYASGCCIGVGSQDDTSVGYHEMICNSILPYTDEEYEVCKPNIEANMTLIAEAPKTKEEHDKMYKALKLICREFEGVAKKGSMAYNALKISRKLLKQIES